MDELEQLRAFRSGDAIEPTPAGRAKARAALEVRMHGGGARPHRARRRRPLFALPIGAAAVAGLALVLVLSGGRDSNSAWAAPVLRVANAVPRLLVGVDGWRVRRADQFAVHTGEMTFGDGTHALELRWQSAQDRSSLVKDRSNSTVRLATVSVNGHEAQVFRYRGTTNDHTAIWRSGAYVLELRGALDQDAFLAVLRSLHTVDVNSWLEAMPDNVVRPGDRAAAVRVMLEGVPVPPGFDTAALAAGNDVRDRYQLGAAVTGAVACAWIGRWADARKHGDNAKLRAAVGAMATSRGWPVLHAMDHEGDYPEVLWMYADAIGGDGTVVGGKKVTVEESYSEALGCDSTAP
jgi:hypothetical protein